MTTEGGRKAKREMQKVESEMRGRCTWTVETACKDLEERSYQLCLEYLWEKNQSSGKNGKIAPGHSTYIWVCSGEKDKESLWDFMVWTSQKGPTMPMHSLLAMNLIWFLSEKAFLPSQCVTVKYMLIPADLHAKRKLNLIPQKGSGTKKVASLCCVIWRRSTIWQTSGKAGHQVPHDRNSSL